MQFVRPQPFTEAVRKLGSKNPVTSQLTSEHWSHVPLALRERAFFSSRVESAHFLQQARDSIADYLHSARDPESGALKTGSRADFVKTMQDFALENGLGSIDEDAKVPNTLTNLASERRLGLIFDTQTRQAQDYGYWQQGMDQDVLDAFPAQRFIRVRPVKEPRDMHQHHEGEVHLKTDLAFWTGLNQDFGVPWGPWGWGCGHDVEDVDRDEAIRLGLLKPAQRPPDLDFNHRLGASVQNLDQDMQDALVRHFGDQVTIKNGTASWTADRKPAPAAAPEKPVRPQANRFVSEALTIARRDPEPLHVAKNVIDQVHDDGTLPRIPVYGSTPPGATGVYELDRAGQPDHIGIKPTSHEHVTFFHEVGHFIDHMALGDKGIFASQRHPDLSEWRAAIAGSLAVKAIASAPQNKTTRYLLDTVECWARSYAQWIVHKAQAKQDLPATLRTSLRAALDEYRTKRMYSGGHWTDEDFAPIASAIDRLFQKKGWIPKI